MVSLLLLSVASGLLAWMGSRLRSDFEMEDFFPRDAPEWEEYREYREGFGRDDREVLLLLESPHPLGMEELRAIDALTRRLEAWPEAESVTSPTNLRAPMPSTDGRMRMERVFDPENPDRLGHLFEVLGRRPFLNAMTSADHRLAVVALTLGEDHLGSVARARVVRSLEREKDALEANGLFQVRLAGYPVHRVYLAEHVDEENRRLLPWAAVLALTASFLFFRNAASLLMPLLGACLSVTWTRGLMVAAGLEPNLLAPALYLLVGLMATSHAVHLLARYQSKLRAGANPRVAARETFREKALPCGITALTTGLVFAGLFLTGVPLVAEFGLSVALGAFSAWSVTLLLAPSLAVIKSESPKTKASPPDEPDKWLRLSAWLSRRSTAVTACFVVLSVLFAFGATRVKVNAPLLADLAADHPVRLTNDLIEEKLGGVVPLDVLLPAPDGPPVAAYEPERMRAIESLAADLRRLPGVLSVSSPVDALRHLSPLLENVSPEEVPSLMPTALLLAPESMGHWVDEDRRVMRLRLRLANLDTDEALSLFATIRETCAARLGPGEPPPVLTGQGYLAQQLNHRLVDLFQHSFCIGLALVALVVAVTLRDARLALVGFPPNLFPLVVVAGFMGITGIDLRYTSALALTVVFGLAVDDTIHVLAELRTRRASPDPMGAALSGAGPGVIRTSVILALGFGVLLASSFIPNRVLGGLLALAAAAAVAADLLWLPALAHASGRFRLSSALSSNPLPEPES